MCDFSLSAFASRPAKVGDKLVTKDFHTGTRGFAAVNEVLMDGGGPIAVCVLPGTELAFDGPIKQNAFFWDKEHTTNVARFTQVRKEIVYAHHDALELPDGEIVMLTTLATGQTATVLQLPAAPRNEKEAEEQKRAEFVG
jgi:hypothetical protein